MRHATSFTLVFLASFSTGVSFLACSADDKDDPPASKPSGRGPSQFDIDNILRGQDAGLPDATGGQDGSFADAGDSGPSPEAGAPSCESCGSAESVKSCGSALTACRADVGCKRIYDCIYTYRGCGLTSSDVDCIQGCFDDYCEDAKSVALYLAYDQCTYCSDACEEACSAYCPAFPKGGTVMSRCSDGVPDSGAGDSDPPDGDTGGEGGSGGTGGGGGSEDPGDAGTDPEEPPQVCVPGRQESCACVGGAQGAQICNSNGTGFGPCACPRPDAGSGSGGEGGGDGSGGSGGSSDDGSGGGSGDDDEGE